MCSNGWNLIIILYGYFTGQIFGTDDEKGVSKKWSKNEIEIHQDEKISKRLKKIFQLFPCRILQEMLPVGPQ